MPMLRSIRDRLSHCSDIFDGSITLVLLLYSALIVAGFLIFVFVHALGTVPTILKQ